MAAIEADAAREWSIPLQEWYDLPRWSRAAMIAQLQKESKIARWREIWRERDNG